jgi:hypothetical protein
MIEINRNSKVYIACPSQVATGGPELLHQLAFKMNKEGYNVKMLYFDELTFSKSKYISSLSKYKDPVHKFYLEYGNDHVKLEDFEESLNDIIVIPEVYTGLIYMFKKIRKVIWWLSVDNFFLKQKEKKYRLKKALFLIESYKFTENSNIFHLAQSNYAIDFLHNKGVSNSKIGYLSDFLNKTFLSGINEIELNSSLRKNVILYNPKKGIEITTKLIELLPDYEWIPIVNLSPHEVKNLLLNSKIYIDFGTHPGKDRFPREAAICGCCVITGLRGSANFFNDVYISDDYKFENPISNIDRFEKTIKSCFDNYNVVIKDFKDYRDRIMCEESVFEEDILKNFVKN